MKAEHHMALQVKRTRSKVWSKRSNVDDRRSCRSFLRNKDIIHRSKGSRKSASSKRGFCVPFHANHSAVCDTRCFSSDSSKDGFANCRKEFPRIRLSCNKTIYWNESYQFLNNNEYRSTCKNFICSTSVRAAKSKPKFGVWNLAAVAVLRLLCTYADVIHQIRRRTALKTGAKQRKQVAHHTNKRFKQCVTVLW
jgi:hypothetical protein